MVSGEWWVGGGGGQVVVVVVVVVLVTVVVIVGCAACARVRTCVWVDPDPYSLALTLALI